MLINILEPVGKVCNRIQKQWTGANSQVSVLIKYYDGDTTLEKKWVPNVQISAVVTVGGVEVTSSAALYHLSSLAVYPWIGYFHLSCS